MPPPTTTAAHPLWDLPTRLFHWALVALFCCAWLSHELGLIEVHFYTGYALLTLLLFRIIWGLVGSRHSRFADFVRGPAAIRRYLRNGDSPGPGHNPLGALSVVATLLLLLTQALSGLFNADDEGNQAPYHHLLSETTANRVGELHQTLFDVLLALIALHLLAIAFYVLRRRMPLIRAMIAGKAPGKQGEVAPVPIWWALLLILVCAGAVGALVWLAPEPQIQQLYF